MFNPLGIIVENGIVDAYTIYPQRIYHIPAAKGLKNKWQNRIYLNIYLYIYK